MLLSIRKARRPTMLLQGLPPVNPFTKRREGKFGHNSQISFPPGLERASNLIPPPEAAWKDRAPLSHKVRFRPFRQTDDPRGNDIQANRSHSSELRRVVADPAAVPFKEHSAPNAPTISGCAGPPPIPIDFLSTGTLPVGAG